MRKRTSSSKLNTQVIIDTAIAYAIVTLAPSLLNRYLFSGQPLTGMTLNLASGAAAYLAGMLAKRPNISNIGVALAVANVIMPMVMQTLAPSVPATTTTSPAARNTSIQEYTRGIALRRLNEYTNVVNTPSPEQYMLAMR